MVDGQVGGKKSPEAQGERRRACKSGVHERAPKARGEQRSPRASTEAQEEEALEGQEERSSRESAAGPGRAPEVQKEQRPGGSEDPRRAAREERVQSQREW